PRGDARLEAARGAAAGEDAPRAAAEAPAARRARVRARAGPAARCRADAAEPGDAPRGGEGAAAAALAGLEQVGERGWPGLPYALEPLGGGLTNHNFKIEVGGETFVLRLGGKDTELLGIDRNAEHAAARVAAGLGIGPGVVDFVDGCLVTRFVP